MSTAMKTDTCKGRWREHKDSRFSDLRKLWKAEMAGDDKEVPNLGRLNEYGLSFDYVEPETFPDQPRGYWRYQLSWGGPSDEIRFYAESSDAARPDRIEYRFMDWFDGHGRSLMGRDLALAVDLWQWFQECGSTEAAYREAHTP